MMLTIDLKGATHLVANLPTDSLQHTQSVIKFFEDNVVSIKSDYFSSEVSADTVATITLGDSVKFATQSNAEHSNGELIIKGRGNSLVEGYEKYTPEVLISFKKEKEAHEKRSKVLQSQIEVLENQLEILKEKNETLEDLNIELKSDLKVYLNEEIA